MSRQRIAVLRKNESMVKSLRTVLARKYIYRRVKFADVHMQHEQSVDVVRFCSPAYFLPSPRCMAAALLSQDFRHSKKLFLLLFFETKRKWASERASERERERERRPEKTRAALPKRRGRRRRGSTENQMDFLSRQPFSVH